MTNRIIYYYQTFSSLKPILVPNTPVTHIHVSSVHFGNNPDGSPYIHLNDNNPDDPTFNTMWKEINQAKRLGIEIVLMVGGAGGAYNDLFNNYDVYFPMLVDTIKKHSAITGIDLDIEEGVELDNVKKLINDIVKTFGTKFTIAMAPLPSSLSTDSPGMGGFVYKQLYNSPEGQYIDYFNGQFYGSFQFEDYDSIIKNGYKPEQVVMGMISGQDFNEVLDTLKQVKHTYPDMGGTFVWEYFNAPQKWDVYVKSVLDPSKSLIQKVNDYAKSGVDLVTDGFNWTHKKIYSLKDIIWKKEPELQMSEINEPIFD